MAHIQINKPKRGGPVQIVINGIDYSGELFRDFEIVEVGEGEYAEVGLRVTFAVGTLDLDADADVRITDRLPAVAQRVRAICEDVA
jgi:hypothetical protein